MTTCLPRDAQVIVASNSELKLKAIRQRYPSAIGQAITSAQLPPQPVNTALQCAHRRLDELVSTVGSSRQTPLLIAIENGIDTLSDGTGPFDVCAVVLQSVGIRCEALSFGIPVERKWVRAAERATEPNFPLRDLGYQITVGQLLHEAYDVPADNWMNDARFGAIHRETQILNAFDQALLQLVCEINIRSK